MENGEEAADIFDDLPSALAAEIAPNSTLPNRQSFVDNVVVRSRELLHLETLRVACRLPRPLGLRFGITPIAEPAIYWCRVPIPRIPLSSRKYQTTKR